MKSDPLTKSILEQKYIEEGLSCKEIAKQLHTARTTVLKYLKIHGIQVRPVGSNQNRKRGIAYGVKSQKRELMSHNRELENIEKMRELRNKGFSYWKIAEIFNSMNIPTKSRKGRWHARTILNCIKGAN